MASSACSNWPVLTSTDGSDSMSTRRIRSAVCDLLIKNQQMNTVEIFDEINMRFRWGATMSQIGNVLAKDKRFRKVGHVRGTFRVGRYQVCLWEMNPDALTITA